MSSRSESRSAASEAVRRLFEDPPLNRGDIKARFHGLPREAVRRALVDLLVEDDVPEGLDGLFTATVNVVKPGKLRNRFSALALDRDRPERVRGLAFSALLEGDRREAERVMERLEPGALERFSERPFRAFVEALVGTDDPGEELRTTLRELETPAEIDALLLAIEDARKRAGLMAADLYGQALREGLLPDREERLAAALAADETEDAVALLEELAESSPSEAARRACREHALRARTAAAERSARGERRRVPEGKAWVTGCDGQGAFHVLAEISPAGGGLPVLAAVCARASSDVRDGFFERDPAPGFAEEVAERLLEISIRVEVPLEVAARLVQDAGKRTKDLGVGVPRDAKASVRAFSRVPAEPLPALPVEPLSDEVSGEQLEARVRRLLVEEAHLEFWFFDAGDLMGADAPLPPTGSDLEDSEVRRQWIDEAARALDGSSIRARLREMARHESRVRAWRGDDDVASLFAALVGELERDGLTGSTLARAMLGVSLDVFEEKRRDTLSALGLDGDDLEEDEGFDDDELDDDELDGELAEDDAFTVLDGELPFPIETIGDPDLRRHLRQELFPELSSPRGKHLARLDFTEVIWPALQEACELLPGEKRPRSDVALRAAGVLASRLSAEISRAFSGGRSRGSAEDVIELVLKELDLDDHLARPVTALVLQRTHSFVAQACAACPVDCLSRPNEMMRREYFADEHPAL